MGGETADPSVARYVPGSDGAQVIVATEMGELQVGFSHFPIPNSVLGERATRLGIEIYYGTQHDGSEREDGFDLEITLEDSVEDEERQREIALVAVEALSQIRKIHTRKSNPS